MDSVKRLQRLKQINQNLIIEKLVRDKNRRQIVDSGMLEEAEITLGSDQFVLIMLDILDYTPGKLNIDLIRKTDRDAVLHSVVEQIFVSSFNISFYTYSFLCDGQSYILINLQTTTHSLSQEWSHSFVASLVTSCAACVKTALDTYGIVVKAYISEFITSLDGLGSAKDHLDLMLADDYIGEKADSVFTGDEMKAAMLSSNVIIDQLYTAVRHILELAQKHKFKEASQVTIDMIRLESRYYGSAAGSRSRLEGLITVLYAVMGVPYFSEHNETLHIHEVLLNMQNCLSTDELIDYMQQLFEDFEKHFSETTRSKQGQMEDIAGYISANYNNPLLCAALISEHFDINQSYLSRLFKEKRNEKMIDCIHKTRLYHAKLLLANTNDTIDTIAEQVGYENTLTFSRAFKRYEGVTPGAFRTTKHL